MKKVCPKCGYSDESGQTKFCSICGALLVKDESDEDDYEYEFSDSEREEDDSYSNDSETQSDVVEDGEDFEFNFGAQNAQNVGEYNAYGQSGSDPYQQNGYNRNMGAFASQETNSVPIKMDDRRANKLKKDLFSWTVYLIFVSILRFIFIFTDMDDINDIRSSLPIFEGEPIYNTLNTLVSSYYAEIVILVLILAASITLTVFCVKLNKYIFPVQDDAVFADAKKTFYASLATLVAVSVYFIIEIICIVVTLRLDAYLEAETSSMSDLIAPFVVDVLLLTGAIIACVNSRKLATCKQ